MHNKNIISLSKSSRVHPKKFALWLGLGSIVMMFAGLTSALIVRKAAGDWVAFELPSLFVISTIVIALSSITLIIAYRQKRNKNDSAYRTWLVATFFLGIVFTVMQYMGWQELQRIGIFLKGNPSGAFLYVISGLHALHVLGGIIVLLYMLISSLRKKDIISELMEDINTERLLSIELLSTYWHFVGILWLYLFLFLRLNI